MSFTPDQLSDCASFYTAPTGRYDATSGGSAVTAERGLVKRWEDQTGNNKHLTQGTDAKCLVWDPYEQAIVSEVGTMPYFDAPASVPFDSRAFTLFVVCKLATVRKNYHPNAHTQYQFFCQTAGDVCNLLQDGQTGRLGAYDGGFKMAATSAYTDWCSIVFNCDTAGITIYVNGVPASTAAINIGTGDLTTLLGSASWPNNGKYRDLALYTRAVTAAEAAQLHAYAITRGVKRSYEQLVAFVGDSITYGTGTTLAQSWPAQMMPGPRRERNISETFAFLASELVPQGAGNVDIYLESGKTNVLFLFGGSNDVASGTSAADTYDLVVEYCEDRRSAGWDYIIIMGMLPRGSDSAIETRRQALRTLMLADFGTATAFGRIKGADVGVAYADYYVDQGADTVIGVAGSQNDTTAYAGDQVHLNSAGETIVASYAGQALSLIPPVLDAIRVGEATVPCDVLAFNAAGLVWSVAAEEYGPLPQTFVSAADYRIPVVNRLDVHYVNRDDLPADWEWLELREIGAPDTFANATLHGYLSRTNVDTIAAGAITGDAIASGAISSGKFTVSAITGVATGILEKIDQLWRRFFRRTVYDGSAVKTYADDGSTVLTTQTLSKSGRTETQGPAA